MSYFNLRSAKSTSHLKYDLSVEYVVENSV